MQTRAAACAVTPASAPGSDKSCSPRPRRHEGQQEPSPGEARGDQRAHPADSSTLCPPRGRLPRTNADASTASAAALERRGWGEVLPAAPPGCETQPEGRHSIWPRQRFPHLPSVLCPTGLDASERGYSREAALLYLLLKLPGACRGIAQAHVALLRKRTTSLSFSQREDSMTTAPGRGSQGSFPTCFPPSQQMSPPLQSLALPASSPEVLPEKLVPAKAFA